MFNSIDASMGVINIANLSEPQPLRPSAALQWVLLFDGSQQVAPLGPPTTTTIGLCFGGALKLATGDMRMHGCCNHPQKDKKEQKGILKNFREKKKRRKERKEKKKKLFLYP